MHTQPSHGNRRLPSYPAAMSTLAFVIALAALCVGGAMATGVLVTSKQIKNGSILTQDIHKNAVKAKSISEGAVGSAEIQDDAVTAPDIGAGQVDSEAIGTGQVTSSDIGNGQVTPQDVTMPEPEQIKEEDVAKLDPASLEFQKVDDAGTYDKQDGESALQVDWTGSVEGHNGGEFSGCVFQIRIDGQPPQGGGGEVFGQGIISVAVSALFPGLAAGQHHIEVWAQLAAIEHEVSNNDSCTVGPVKAGISQTFVVSEQVL